MNETTNDYGEEGKVRFLRAESFQRQLPRRKFPFRFKITDIEGGAILPIEPNLKLVTDRPNVDQISLFQRVRSWMRGLFDAKEVTAPVEDADNHLTQELIKSILAKKGLRQ